MESMKRVETPKKTASLAIDAFAAEHQGLLAELPDFQEPAWWAARVERLYRNEVVPRLEAKKRLTRIDKQVLAKARAFLAAVERGR